MADLDHYFTADEPAPEGERRPLRTVLADREVTVETAGGIFSPGGLDKATAILLDEVPDPPASGAALDPVRWLAERGVSLPSDSDAEPTITPNEPPSTGSVDLWR